MDSKVKILSGLIGTVLGFFASSILWGMCRLVPDDWISILIEFISAVGTVGAVVVAVWQSFFGIQRDQRIKDKKMYEKILIKNVLNLQRNVRNVKTIFDIQNNPITQENYQEDHSISDIDTILKSKPELEKEIYSLINGLEFNLQLAKIDEFISIRQSDEAFKYLKKVSGDVIDLFSSIQSTESEFTRIDSYRDPLDGYDELTLEEKELFNDTLEKFNTIEESIKTLKKSLERIFN